MSLEKTLEYITQEEVVGRCLQRMTMDDDKRAPSPPVLSTVGFPVFRVGVRVDQSRSLITDKPQSDIRVR